MKYIYQIVKDKQKQINGAVGLFVNNYLTTISMRVLVKASSLWNLKPALNFSFVSLHVFFIHHYGHINQESILVQTVDTIDLKILYLKTLPPPP